MASRPEHPTITTSLQASTALGLIEAAFEADRIGLPLNRFLTIDWEKGRAGDGSFATAQFLRRVNAWFARRGAATAFIWVREAGPKNGQHAHILLHVPDALAKQFVRLQRGWFAQCGLDWARGNVKGKWIGRTRSRSAGPAAAVVTYRTGLMNLVHYLLKEVEPIGRTSLGVTLTGSGLEVTGKRAGWSENMGPTARNAAGTIYRVNCVGDLGRLSGRDFTRSGVEAL